MTCDRWGGVSASRATCVAAASTSSTASASTRTCSPCPPATPVVAVVARLNPIGGMEIKGVGHFLEAAAILAGRFPDARFLVVGDGPARAGLEKMARRLGPRRVVFTGFRRDVARILAD